MHEILPKKIARSISRYQAKARLLAYSDPASFERLIDLLVDVSADYLVRQVKAGARALNPN